MEKRVTVDGSQDYLYNLAAAIRDLSPNSFDSHLYALEVSSHKQAVLCCSPRVGKGSCTGCKDKWRHLGACLGASLLLCSQPHSIYLHRHFHRSPFRAQDCFYSAFDPRRHDKFA